MKRLLLACLFVLVPQWVMAQTTQVLSATSAAQWTPSPDNAALFNGQPIVTTYQGKLFLKPVVVGGIEPTSTPALTLDFGKPTPDGSNLQTGPALKPLVLPNVEYIMFLHAVGPGGTSAPTAASVPFGSLAVPRAVPSAVTITP